MKERDIKTDYRDHQMVMYAEKEDGSFGSVQTGSFMAANYLDDFFDKRAKTEAHALSLLKAGSISPIGYYMMLTFSSRADIAARVGVRVGVLKKHELPRHFTKIRIPLLMHYAEVFGVSMSQLFSIVPSSGQPSSITFEKTANPCITILSVKKP